MIMPKDQPRDDDLPVFPSLDALNRDLQQRTAEYNKAPQDELGGLCQELPVVAKARRGDWLSRIWWMTASQVYLARHPLPVRH